MLTAGAAGARHPFPLAGIGQIFVLFLPHSIFQGTDYMVSYGVGVDEEHVRAII
jgi:hypothetical protein